MLTGTSIVFYNQYVAKLQFLELLRLNENFPLFWIALWNTSKKR